MKCQPCNGWGFTTTNLLGQAHADETENTSCPACDGTGWVNEVEGEHLTPAYRREMALAIEKGVD